MKRLIDHIRILNITQLAILIAILPCMLAVWKLQDTFIVPLVLIPVVMGGFYYWEQLSENWKTIYVAVLVAIILVFAARIGLTVGRNIASPSEWDFTGFWIHGRTAVQGLNFYDPENAQKIAQSLTLSDVFRQEIVNVGFWYPPPSILMFVPLGFFSLQTAGLLWNIFQMILFVVCIVLLWQTFLKEKGWLGGLLVACLMVMLQPTRGTFLYTQTNFMTLFCLIMFWRNRDNSRSGIWLTLGILTKPLLAFVLLYLLLRKRWRTLAASAITLAILCAVTILLFGTNTFFGYFTYSPMSRIPAFVYNEVTNQSLLALVLQVTDYDFSARSPYFNPVFVVLALVLTGFSAWLIYRLDAKNEEWGIFLALLLGFIIYPTIGNHYLILLMVPFLVLWLNRDRLPGQQWGVILFIDLLYILFTYTDGKSAFVGVVLFWMTLVVIIIGHTTHKLVTSEFLPEKA